MLLLGKVPDRWLKDSKSEFPSHKVGLKVQILGTLGLWPRPPSSIKVVSICIYFAQWLYLHHPVSTKATSSTLTPAALTGLTKSCIKVYWGGSDLQRRGENFFIVPHFQIFLTNLNHNGCKNWGRLRAGHREGRSQKVNIAEEEALYHGILSRYSWTVSNVLSIKYYHAVK